MDILVRFSIGILVLILGIPIGNFLAKITKEELDIGQKWFKSIVIIAILGAFVSIIFINDFLMFSFLFIAIVTSRSLKVSKKRKDRLKKEDN